MGLFRVKEWPIIDLTIFKWTTTLFGIIIGAYFSDFFLDHIVPVVVLAVIGAVKTVHFYYK